MTHPETTGRINSILLQTAIKADPIVDRSHAQKMLRVEKMKAELFDLGFSVVSTEWLKAVIAEAPLIGMSGKVVD